MVASLAINHEPKLLQLVCAILALCQHFSHHFQLMQLQNIYVRSSQVTECKFTRKKRTKNSIQKSFFALEKSDRGFILPEGNVGFTFFQV